MWFAPRRASLKDTGTKAGSTRPSRALPNRSKQQATGADKHGSYQLVEVSAGALFNSGQKERVLDS
jgi:hypothetical protein